MEYQEVEFTVTGVSDYITIHYKMAWRSIIKVPVPYLKFIERITGTDIDTFNRRMVDVDTDGEVRRMIFLSQDWIIMLYTGDVITCLHHKDDDISSYLSVYITPDRELNKMLYEHRIGKFPHLIEDVNKLFTHFIPCKPLQGGIMCVEMSDELKTSIEEGIESDKKIKECEELYEKYLIVLYSSYGDRDVNKFLMRLDKEMVEKTGLSFKDMRGKFYHNDF